MSVSVHRAGGLAGRAAVVTVMALAGCAGQAPQPQSPGDQRSEQTGRAYQRAGDAIARRDYPAALRQYRVALTRSRTVEDRHGTAIALLNIAAVLHKTGDFAGARAQLEILTAPQSGFADEYVGRAEARLALIELQEDHAESAGQHAARAQQLCPSEACPWRLAVQNVSAAVALANGDVALAKTRTQETIASAKRAGDVSEEANAWRVLGQIALKEGRISDCREAWSTALSMDKSMDAVERIALDLLLLARLEVAAGNLQAGHNYAQRAAAIAEAAKLNDLSAQTRTLLDKAASQ